MTDYYFSADNKTKTAQLFVQNLMWGNVGIEYDKFGTREEGLEIVKELDKKMKQWDAEMMTSSLYLE